MEQLDYHLIANLCEDVVAHTTRAREDVRPSRLSREVLRALWSPTLHAQRAGAVGRCNPCPFSIQPQVTQPIPALPVRKGLWPWPTRKDRRHPESNRQRFPYEPRVIGGKLLMPAELQAIHRYVLETPVLENVSRNRNSHRECLA